TALSSQVYLLASISFILGLATRVGAAVLLALTVARGRQRCRNAHDSSPAHCTDMGIRLLLRLAKIQTEPAMTRKTISRPKARARMLFVLSGPLPRCRKNTRWTPICAKASTTNPTGMPGAQSKLVCDTMNEAIVARIARPSPAVYDR